MSTTQLPPAQLNLIDALPGALHLTPELEASIPSHLYGTPFQTSFTYAFQNQKKFQQLLKRSMDIICSASGLLLLSLPLLLIAIAIQLDSKGPILFKQKRVGMHGQDFYMYKFRSMCNDAEDRLAALLEHNEIQSGMFKMQKDPRITNMGRFLRKYSIDEIPQLLNVFKGEMSLVGPRPPLRRELRDYKDWHYIRFSVPPGMTGEWQVNGRSSITHFDDVVRLDFKYIQAWSFWSDLRILLKTIPVVCVGKNAA